MAPEDREDGSQGEQDPMLEEGQRLADEISAAMRKYGRTAKTLRDAAELEELRGRRAGRLGRWIGSFICFCFFGVRFGVRDPSKKLP